MKGILLMLVITINCFVMDYVDAGIIGLKYAIILAVFDLLALGIFLMVEKKKSATSHTRNGQAYHRHTKLNHHKFTPYKGGMSSVL